MIPTVANLKKNVARDKTSYLSSREQMSPPHPCLLYLFLLSLGTKVRNKLNESSPAYPNLQQNYSLVMPLNASYILCILVFNPYHRSPAVRDKFHCKASIVQLSWEECLAFNFLGEKKPSQKNSK